MTEIRNARLCDVALALRDVGRNEAQTVQGCEQLAADLAAAAARDGRPPSPGVEDSLDALRRRAACVGDAHRLVQALEHFGGVDEALAALERLKRFSRPQIAAGGKGV